MRGYWKCNVSFSSYPQGNGKTRKPNTEPIIYQRGNRIRSPEGADIGNVMFHFLPTRSAMSKHGNRIRTETEYEPIIYQRGNQTRSPECADIGNVMFDFRPTRSAMSKHGNRIRNRSYTNAETEYGTDHIPTHVFKLKYH